MTDAPSLHPKGPRLDVLTEIDASCRLPLFVLFLSAAAWLVIGSGFELIATIKFHNPNFLADHAWLTYGRVRPAYLDAVIYGFCLQAGLGVALWLITRLGRTAETHPWMISVGAALFNIGVTLGILGILSGDATGFEIFDFPQYAAVFIFLGYLMISIRLLVTFHRRRERLLFVSQWFLLAALFWFPWIYSTAGLLLLSFPVRGVVQAIIAWWFSNNLLCVWLGLMGLAAIFYFIPKLTNTELHSRYLALLTFWFILFFGSWGGIPNSAPVPAWIPALSTVATVLMIFPIISIALNFYGTLKEQRVKAASNVPLRFICLGLLGFIVSGLMNVVAVLPSAGDVVSFSWFTVARVHANFYGFFSFVMFGAIYYIVPQITGLEFTSPKWVRRHLWIVGLGILLVVLPLAIGGLVQGLKLRDPNAAFMDISKSTLMFLRASTLGDLLIAFGHIIFLINLLGVLKRFSEPRALASYAAATANLFHAEAKT